VRSIHTAVHKRLIVRLRQARLQSGLTQSQVARKLRKPQSFVSSCESGQRRIDVVELHEFAKLYRVRLSYFLQALKAD
jgi:transcriptional regulator with XRE-family HTH domain